MRPVRVALVAALALIPATTSAQLGGLARRAADKAAAKAVEKKIDRATSERPAPAFDNEVLELTERRIDQVVRGLRAWNDARAKADVPGAIRAHEAAQARQLAYAERYTDQRTEWQQRNWKIDACRDQAFGEQNDRNQAQIEKGMEAVRRDPAKMTAMSAKSVEWAPRLAALQQQGDTAGYIRGMLQMQQELAAIGGFKVEVDSGAVTAKCGTVAPKPAWLAAWDSTEVETRKAGDRVREAETAGSAEAAAASGMTERQFAIARERVESFVHGGGMGFSRRERDALTPRRAELAAYFPRQ